MAIEPLIDHYTVDLRDENNYYFAKDPQGDGSSRFLKITIEDNHEPYTLDPNNSYVMGGKNPAGYGVFISCEIDTTDNTLIIPLTDSVLADKGLGVYQIFIYSNSEPNVSSSLVTFPFNIFVIESPLDMNEMTRSNDYQELAYLINRANSFNGWYVGTGFPQIEDSKPGDYYLDQANGNIYVMDNNGWNVTPVGNIKMKTYVRYSHNSSGYPMTEHPVYKESNPSTYSRYVGFYCGTNNTAPSYSLFDWVYFEGPKGEKGDTGNNGQDGVTPNITATATINNNTGTPNVDVVKSGTLSNPSFAFNFSNLRGEKGEKGDTGANGVNGTNGITPNITATATINNTTGIPEVNITKGGTTENPSFAFAFSNLKGLKGDTGNTGPQGQAGRDVTSITMSGSGKTHPITATYSDGTSETVGTVRDGEDGQGSGDMTKAQYDTQNHGYVDASACVTDGTNSLTYSQIHAGIQGSGGAYDLVKDTVGWARKNILDIPLTVKTTEKNSVTFTVTRDCWEEVTEIDVHSDTYANTNTSFILLKDTAHNLSYLNGKILSGCTNGSNSSYYLAVYDYDNWTPYVIQYDEEVIINGIPDNNTNVAVLIWVKYYYQQLNHIKFYPMIRDASIDDNTFEPYRPTVDTVMDNKADWDTRNLLPNTAEKKQYINGVNFTVNDDGSIIVDGTATNDVHFIIYEDKQNSCPFNGYILSGCPESGSMSSFDLRVSDITTGSTSDIGEGTIISLADTGQWRCEIVIQNGQRVYNKVFKPMIQLASNEYKSYTPHRQSLDNTFASNKLLNIVGGKNLLKNNINSQTINGIEFTVYNDGSFKLNGTATDNIELVLYEGMEIPFEQEYILSKGSSSSNYALIFQIKYLSSWLSYKTSREVDENSFILNAVYSGYQINNTRVIFTINAESVLSNVYVYPMIRPKACIDNTYEPYAMTNRQLTTRVAMSKSEAVVQYGTVDSSVGNNIVKCGQVVMLSLQLTGVTCPANSIIAEIPYEYRPMYPYKFTIDGKTIEISTIGRACIKGSQSNSTIPLFATWICDL